jgi:uncharacterized protein YaiL (DUF2058 family)
MRGVFGRMGGLRDELLKAKLISSKAAKKAARENQLKRKEIGKTALENEKHERDAEYSKWLAEKQGQDKQRELQRRETEKTSIRLHQLRDIIRNGIIVPKRPRNNKFYFIAPDGSIPYLTVSADEIEVLVQGEAAIVQMPSDSTQNYILINRDAARKIKREGSEFIMVFNEK